MQLYKAFIIPYFQYCNTIWHFCSARNTEKLELLNKHALKIILNGNFSSYMMLLKKLDLASLKTGRLLVILTALYKSLLGIMLAYASSLLRLRNNINNLGGINKLQIPRVNTTSCGKHSTRFLVAKLWNELHDKLRTSSSTTYFKNNVDLASLLTIDI